jgi:hypothetical protein
MIPSMNPFNGYYYQGSGSGQYATLGSKSPLRINVDESSYESFESLVYVLYEDEEYNNINARLRGGLDDGTNIERK